MALQHTNAEIAAEWRRICVSPYMWRPCVDQAGVITGEAGGYWVEAHGFPRRGYLKPANSHPDEHTHYRAAREKIACDVACDLSLSLPPALLTTRDNPPSGCTACVVVTLVMYPAQWNWATVRTHTIDPTPVGAAMAGALARCSAMLAFDTWVAQTDHGDHPDNIVWGYDPAALGDSAIVFLDYANALGFNGQWTAGQWQQTQAAQWPPLLLKYLDKSLVEAMVARIEAFPEATIREIVSRIPDSHLPQVEKGIVTEGLACRRSLVRDALRSVLQV